MGQALFERVVYDADSAQLLTGSVMDYAMPRASDIPAIAIEMREMPTKVNMPGVKGVGEAGTIPVPTLCPRHGGHRSRCRTRWAPARVLVPP